MTNCVWRPHGQAAHVGIELVGRRIVVVTHRRQNIFAQDTFTADVLKYSALSGRHTLRIVEHGEEVDLLLYVWADVGATPAPAPALAPPSSRRRGSGHLPPSLGQAPPAAHRRLFGCLSRTTRPRTADRVQELLVLGDGDASPRNTAFSSYRKFAVQGGVATVAWARIAVGGAADRASARASDPMRRSDAGEGAAPLALPAGVTLLGWDSPLNLRAGSTPAGAPWSSFTTRSPRRLPPTRCTPAAARCSPSSSTRTTSR